MLYYSANYCLTISLTSYLFFQGSGSNVDLCVITKEGVNYIRPYDVANVKGERQGKYTYKRGTTGIIYHNGFTLASWSISLSGYSIYFLNQ